MSQVTITNSHFTGANLDGSIPVDPVAGVVKLDGWHCIGPRYYGRPSLRTRLGWWLLGIAPIVRPENVSFEGGADRPMHRERMN